MARVGVRGVGVAIFRRRRDRTPDYSHLRRSPQLPGVAHRVNLRCRECGEWMYGRCIGDQDEAAAEQAAEHVLATGCHGVLDRGADNCDINGLLMQLKAQTQAPATARP